MTYMLLLDTSSLMYRAFFALPTSLTGNDGQPINAVHGYLDMTARLVAICNPTNWCMCMTTTGDRRVDRPVRGLQSRPSRRSAGATATVRLAARGVECAGRGSGRSERLGSRRRYRRVVRPRRCRNPH